MDELCTFNQICREYEAMLPYLGYPPNAYACPGQDAGLPVE